MKVFLSFILIFLGLSAFCQEPPYTPMNSNYKFKGIRVDSLFLIPSFADTNTANTQRCATVAGSMIRTGNDFWMRNATMNCWLQNVNIGGGASPVLSFINEVFKKSGTDSIFYVIAPHDTTFAYLDLGVDTTNLSNRIDNKIQDLKRSSDSVYYNKTGSWVFAYKDSVPIKDTPTLAMVLSKGHEVLPNNNNFQGLYAGDNAPNAQHNNFFGNRAGADTYGNGNNFFGLEAGRYSSTSGINGFGQSAGFANTGIASNFFGMGAGANNTRDGVNLFGYMSSANGDNQTVFSKNASPSPLMARISYNSISADRSYRLPDSSGTIALLENITGGGSNFANADLTATGNRYHTFKNYNLTIDSAYKLELNSNHSNLHASYFKMDGDNFNLYTIHNYSTMNGLILDPEYGVTTLINRNNFAYLSQKPFVEDTLAMLGDIKPDGPDRINGLATNDVTADMAGYNLSFKYLSNLLMSDSFGNGIIVNNPYKGYIGIYGNTLDVDTDTMKIATTEIATPNGKIYESTAKKVDCITLAFYDISAPGVYNLYNLTTIPTVVRMPNPATFPGGVIYIVNHDANPLPFGGSYLPIDAGGNAVSQIYKTTASYVSDGTDWIIVL